MSGTTETVVLCGGCFWPTQELLRHRDGVISTRVGYTGGENDHPTEEDHPGHAEAVEVTFDPERLSYEDLLRYFLQMHRTDLSEEIVGEVHRSAIFCTTDEQRRTAERMIAEFDTTGIVPGKVVTDVKEAVTFWEAPAEDQDYLERYPAGHRFF